MGCLRRPHLQDLLTGALAFWMRGKKTASSHVGGTEVIPLREENLHSSHDIATEISTGAGPVRRVPLSRRRLSLRQWSWRLRGDFIRFLSSSVITEPPFRRPKIRDSANLYIQFLTCVQLRRRSGFWSLTQFGDIKRSNGTITNSCNTVWFFLTPVSTGRHKDASAASTPLLGLGGRQHASLRKLRRAAR
ncbi:hypothetical protein HPP92_029126 [Vanilla planifolia]|uniref:Uncharacterized protein n=1 Tax=Vanilla planifolia TaxID=51239 RepID=A0A835U2F8_VANPL|nr:hypothetical protein HPP92_029126 [Vanilla planifolia]KAG0445882.1 hypothetical protein HPP92_029114 [Vanilla planifolia]